MSATAWIHRLNAPDLLICFPETSRNAFRRAWNCCIQYLTAPSIREDVLWEQQEYREETALPYILDGTYLAIGWSQSVQVCCYSGIGLPPPHPSGFSWNTEGFIRVNIGEAIALGDTGVPETVSVPDSEIRNSISLTIAEEEDEEEDEEEADSTDDIGW
jgi:hypothetical protein